MRLRTALTIAACLLCAPPVMAQTITAPSKGPDTVASANDFATRAFQDPWDMNERTDFGYFLHGIDAPAPGFASVAFANGIFTGVTSNTDPNLWLLETGFPGSVQTGKIGTNYPIDATSYKTVAIRMSVNTPSFMQFFWSTGTMYDPPGLQSSKGVTTSAGWKIYFVDLQALGLIAGTQPWTGTMRSLRFDPTVIQGDTVQIDWIRLTQTPVTRNITWTGAGNMDIYLSATNNASTLLGLVASGVSGGTYPLPVGALAPGDYYVAMRPTGTGGNFVFSPGFYRVNAPATVTVTAPSEEGSSDDFATTQLGNPWDMNSVSDFDLTWNVTGGVIGTVVAETPAGTPLGTINAFIGTSALPSGARTGNPCADAGDPILYPMNASYRGYNNRIDPARYRILTVEMGLPDHPRDICNGSVVRVIWQVAGDLQENVSQNIILNSRAGANVLDKINLDMAAVPVEPLGPATDGWVAGTSAKPGIASFRLDPHEFWDPTTFYVKRIKLAALEKANASYTVAWTASKAVGTVRVSFNTIKDPNSNTLINSVPATLTGSLVWNTSGMSPGQYFVYVEYDDGLNVNGTYSKWPIVVDHTIQPTARLVINRPTLNFGIVAQTTQMLTPPQTVQVTAVGAAAGLPCWTVNPDPNPVVAFVLIDGQTGPVTKCGSGSFAVSILDQKYFQTGTGFATLTVTSAGAANSPQYVQAWYRITNSPTRPYGTVDTPVEGATVYGSVGFTGWAVDDVGVTRVTLCRDAVTSEAAPIDGRCGGAAQIYIGDAVLLNDARPDVQAMNPASAVNYRAGWGFLALTNMLPNQGNGTFKFYVRAFDVEGGFTLLGTRTLFADNINAPAPFGAIDTPAQGETISGNAYVNFGWALTPMPKSIAKDGSTILVYIDGVPVGRPTYNNFRADIAGLFPGLNNSNGAVGFFVIDTTAYADGIHTIAWVVTDSSGNATGIGSRYFTILNNGGS